MGFEKKIVIDARGHLLGRLASTVGALCFRVVEYSKFFITS